MADSDTKTIIKIFLPFPLILYKMEIVDRVSAFRNYQNFFWRHCRKTEASKWKWLANKKRLKLSDCFDYEEKEWIRQVVCYSHSPALFTQSDESDFEAEKSMNGSLKCLG